jgi:hypothetical protein
VLVFDRCTGALTVLAFVLGVLTLVAGGFGALGGIPGWRPRLRRGDLCRGAQDSPRRGQPLHECRPVAVIDRKLGLFSYGGGAVVPMDQVRFARRLQIGSSSPKLVAVTPGGTHVLKRGNPFDGGVGTVDELLSAVVRSG